MASMTLPCLEKRFLSPDSFSPCGRFFTFSEKEWVAEPGSMSRLLSSSSWSAEKESRTAAARRALNQGCCSYDRWL